MNYSSLAHVARIVVVIRAAAKDPRPPFVVHFQATPVLAVDRACVMNRISVHL